METWLMASLTALTLALPLALVLAAESERQTARVMSVNSNSGMSLNKVS